jgi:hypothetical protein
LLELAGLYMMSCGVFSLWPETGCKGTKMAIFTKAAIAAVLLGQIAPVKAGASESAASRSFDELKTLVGNWEGSTPTGRPIKVSYRLTANDNVLVETWTLGPTRESMTLYHLDGRELLADHYCPLGNQPRLKMARPTGSKIFRFGAISVTNLASRGAAHQQAFELRLIDAQHFWRSEIYVENDVPESEGLTYTRVAPPAPVEPR